MTYCLFWLYLKKSIHIKSSNENLEINQQKSTNFRQTSVCRFYTKITDGDFIRILYPTHIFCLYYSPEKPSPQDKTLEYSSTGTYRTANELKQKAKQNNQSLM